ncbi:MAG: hypothetical protein NDI61_14775 [Bdellovibrionaceae bacterium]|nr:hypothetical protein [Pseudobdellovibrionaceae bacterium]
MKSRLMFFVSVLTLSVSSFAHDEGHGPKLTDSGKYGGLVSGMVMKAEASKGAKATLVHKAELVRSSDGAVRIYVYDLSMKPLDTKRFASKGSAVLIAKVKGKSKESVFALEQKDGAFVGKMPKPEAKPFNIDVTLKDGDKEVLSAFDNLD